MKPRTYFGIALLFPYLLWVICALIVFILSRQETSTDWSTVLMPVFYYAFGILLWFIPYTLLAIGLWVWSKNKSEARLHKFAIRSPLFLLALMAIESLWISLPAEGVSELASNLFSELMLLGGFSLVFGYLCVGVALGIYKLLQTRGLIQEEISLLLPEN